MTTLTISQLGSLLGVSTGENLSLSVRQNISVAANNALNLIVPDIAREPISGVDSVVTLVPIKSGELLSPLYAKKHLMIELGMAVAGNGGKAGEPEIVQLSYIMEQHFRFTELEIRALTALKDFALLYPPDIDITTRRLVKELSQEERTAVAKMMVTVAAAGGHLARNELGALRRLLDGLEIREVMLDQFIKELRIKRIWVLVKNF
jgi:uncharacterized tellurite resistance protein B-like protein